MMTYNTYLNDNTRDNRRADLSVIITVTENNSDVRHTHYNNRSLYQNWLNRDSWYDDNRKNFVGVYEFFARLISDTDNGIKTFDNTNFPDNFHSQEIHDWLRYWETDNLFPRISMIAIMGGEDHKFMELSCHLVSSISKTETRGRG